MYWIIVGINKTKCSLRTLLLHRAIIRRMCIAFAPCMVAP